VKIEISIGLQTNAGGTQRGVAYSPAMSKDSHLSTGALVGSVAIRDRLVCCRSLLATGTVDDRGAEQGD
jgi:hypothetical protein